MVNTKAIQKGINACGGTGTFLAHSTKQSKNRSLHTFPLSLIINFHVSHQSLIKTECSLFSSRLSSVFPFLSAPQPPPSPRPPPCCWARRASRRLNPNARPPSRPPGPTSATRRGCSACHSRSESRASRSGPFSPSSVASCSLSGSSSC